MILLDTNIIIDFWKYPNEEKKAFLKNNKCCICGMVVADDVHYKHIQDVYPMLQLCEIPKKG